MFKPVAPPPPRGILNLPLPVALPFVLFLVLLTGASLSVVTFAIGAGGLGGGGGGGGGGGEEEDFLPYTSTHSIILTPYQSPLIVTCPSCSIL